MATAVIAFRWLDVLEHEFDKAFVELDCLLPEMDCEEPEMIDIGRKKLTSLSSAFAQLVHKAQTIFQNNAKLEAQVLDSQQRLINCGSEASSEGVTPSTQEDASQKLVILERKCAELERGNETLKQTVLALQGEVYGARLASRYLDQELAGRIQQLQLVCNPNPMTQDVQKKLWDQIESEIFLHRHKTVVRACRGQNTPQSPQEDMVKIPLSTSMLNAGNLSVNATNNPPGIRSQSIPSERRVVKLHRDDKRGLGISITGGSDHGLPVLVSKVGENSVATGKVFVGDSILSVNGVDLSKSKHSDAAHIMSDLRGEVTLELLYTESQESEPVSISSSSLKYEIFSEKVGYQLNDASVDQCIQSASSADNKRPSSAVKEETPAVNTQQAPAVGHDTSNNNTYPTQNAAGKELLDATSKQGNGTLANNTTTSNRPSSDLDTDLAKSKSPKHIVKVGHYRMSNIQSLDEGEDNSLFSSND